MPMAFNLDEHDCAKCGEDDLYWWRKDETETTLEVYMNCDACGYEYPKLFVDKSEETSDQALIDRLVDRHL